MPRSHNPYPTEFRQQMVDLVRAGRSPNELAREFEPSAPTLVDMDLEVFGGGTPWAALSAGDDRISQVPGEPLLSVCPGLGLRQDGGSQTGARAPHGPRYLHDEGSPRGNFRSSIAGPSDSLSTLRRTVQRGVAQDLSLLAQWHSLP